MRPIASFAVLAMVGVLAGLYGPLARGADPVFRVVPQDLITNPSTGTKYMIAGQSYGVDVLLELSQPAGQEVWGAEYRINVTGGVPITLNASGTPPYTGDAFTGFDLLSGFQQVRVGQLSGRSTDIIAHGFDYGPITTPTGSRAIGKYSAAATAPLVGTTTFVFDNTTVYVGSGTATHSIVNDAFGIVARGDVDYSGTLTQGDLQTLANNFGMLSGGTWALGDCNSDGKVNLADVAVFTQSYAQWGGGPLSAVTPGGLVITVVPEPSLAGCLAVLMVGAVVRRPRRRTR